MKPIDVYRQPDRTLVLASLAGVFLSLVLLGIVALVAVVNPMVALWVSNS